MDGTLSWTRRAGCEHSGSETRAAGSTSTTRRRGDATLKIFARGCELGGQSTGRNFYRPFCKFASFARQLPAATYLQRAYVSGLRPVRVSFTLVTSPARQAIIPVSLAVQPSRLVRSKFSSDELGESPQLLPLARAPRNSRFLGPW